jgi:hypothetical protein
LSEPEKTSNKRVGVGKQTLYDPKEIAKRTIKETTLSPSVLGGVETLEGSDGYIDANYEAKTTNKEITSDNFYCGHGEQENGDGYRTVSVNAPTTSKQIMSDNEYVGNATAETAAAKSYENARNAVINATRETTLNREIPATQGVKSAAGEKFITLTQMPMDNEGGNNHHVNRIIQTVSNPKDSISTRPGQGSKEMKERNSPDILTAFRENPYTQSLHSTA